MKKLKNEKAITLVALVVTIIVLIILASISINLVLGENGIITKARDTRDETGIASQKEQISLAYLSATTKTETTGGSQIANLRKELKKTYEEIQVFKTTKTNGNKGIKVYIKDTDKYFFIDNTGNVTNVTKEELESKPPKDVYAALYKLEAADNPEDLELVFYSLDNGEKPTSLNSRTLIAPDDENQNWNISNEFMNKESIPWYDYRLKIKEATIENEVIPICTARWFQDCTALKKINNINNLNTCNVTTMDGMFYICSAIAELDVSNFETSNVTTMAGMFCACNSLKNIDLSNFNTTNVTDMNSMFADCYSLTNLDLLNFNTANVTNMGWMFNNTILETLDLSNFDTRKVTSFKRMFNNSTSLKNIYVGENWNTEKNTEETKYVFPATCYLPNFSSSNDEYRYLKWAYVGEGGYLSTKPTE